MAESFNNAPQYNQADLLANYKKYTKYQYTAAENGKAAMEERELQRAQEAIQEGNFLSLTLTNKLGIGERVVQQIGDTALNAVTGILRPLEEWFDKYESVIDENMFTNLLNSDGKQLYFSYKALSNETLKTSTGQNFVADF